MDCFDESLKKGKGFDSFATNSLFVRVGRALGDSIMATAVIEGIHKQYPCLRIFVLVKYKELFYNNPYVTACYDVRTVREKNPSLFERFVDLGCPSYTDIRLTKKRRHLIDHMYDNVPLAITERHYHPKIYLTQRERSRNLRKLQCLARPLVAISPFGRQRSRIPNKIYPYEQWKETASQLLEGGVNILQVGKKEEGPLLPGVHDWRNIGYRRTAAVLLHCDAVVTHVGGIMHLATAVSVPCVTLFAGVEDPHISGYEANVNLFVPLECSPCWLVEPCADRKCVNLLSPEKIVQETLNLIKSHPHFSKP